MAPSCFRIARAVARRLDRSLGIPEYEPLQP